MVSAATVVPVNVAVVWLVAVWLSVSAGVDKSFALHAHPFGAVSENVMITVCAVHVAWNEPAVLPPTWVLVEHVPVRAGGDPAATTQPL